MHSFGPVLRKLRGSHPLTDMARRLGISKSYLANLETGRKVPDEQRARQLLARGFGLPPGEVTRLILEVQLYDHGLHDRELRHLVIDLIQATTPPAVSGELRRLYRRYAADRSHPPDGELLP